VRGRLPAQAPDDDAEARLHDFVAAFRAAA
jgi:hypothetical protein